MIAFKFDDPDRRLEREYRLVLSSQTYVSPEYARSETPWIAASEAEQVIIRVYRRIAASRWRQSSCYATLCSRANPGVDASPQGQDALHHGLPVCRLGGGCTTRCATCSRAGARARGIYNVSAILQDLEAHRWKEIDVSDRLSGVAQSSCGRACSSSPLRGLSSHHLQERADRQQQMPDNRHFA